MLRKLLLSSVGVAALLCVGSRTPASGQCNCDCSDCTEDHCPVQWYTCSMCGFGTRCADSGYPCVGAPYCGTLKHATCTPSVVCGDLEQCTSSNVSTQSTCNGNEYDGYGSICCVGP